MSSLTYLASDGAFHVFSSNPSPSRRGVGMSLIEKNGTGPKKRSTYLQHVVFATIINHSMAYKMHQGVGCGYYRWWVPCHDFPNLHYSILVQTN